MPCASSTMTSAANSRATDTISGSGVMSPSIEKTPSMTTSRPLASLLFLHLAAQVRGIVVLESLDVPERQPGPVDDAGVVLLVQVDGVPLAHETGDGAQVHLEAGRERDGGLLTHELGQPLFELHVEVERSVQEAAARATGPVAPDRVDRGLLDAGVVGQTEIVVGTHHHQTPARDDDLGILGGFDDPEKGVVAGLANASGLLVAVALLEDRSGPDRVHTGYPGAFAHHPPTFGKGNCGRILANFTKLCREAIRRAGTTPRSPADPPPAGRAPAGSGDGWWQPRRRPSRPPESLWPCRY